MQDSAAATQATSFRVVTMSGREQVVVVNHVAHAERALAQSAQTTLTRHERGELPTVEPLALRRRLARICGR